jgi:SpoVK/Ycf46/Vps4 family AAA+-type ATPase
MSDFEGRVVPTRGMDKLVLSEAVERCLMDLVGFVKSQKTLVSDWGFGADGQKGLGATALFHGPPGTGKSISAEAVAFELGLPLKLVSSARVISKWVGEGSKNIEALFREARANDAVLVFDEADALFGGRTAVATFTDRYANLEVAVLLREIERYQWIVILTTNLFENIDPIFLRRLRIVIGFEAPDRSARRRLWELELSRPMPHEEGISFDSLADKPLTGAQIRNAVVRAASRAALRTGPDRRVDQSDLMAAADEELRSAGTGRGVGFESAKE